MSDQNAYGDKAYSYTFADEDSVLRISVRQGGSLRSVYDLVTDFTSDSRFTPGMGIVADARGGDYTPTVPDLICLGKMIGDMKENFTGPIAIVVERKGLKFAVDLMCATARAEGFNIRSFVEETEAADWIKSGGEGQAARQA